MKLVGLMVTRNSDWIIGFSLRAALLWCDSVVVLMHNCTHETLDIVSDVDAEMDSDEVVVLQSDCFEWKEMGLRQKVLNEARKMGATHIALIDDDEVLTADLLPRIRRMVETTSDWQVLMLPWLQLSPHFGQGAKVTDLGVMTSGMWARASASTGFKDSPIYHWATRDGYDLHHRHPMGATLQWNIPFEGRDSGLMHFQFASRRRLLAKQYLYQLTEMKRWPGRKPISEVMAYYSRSVEEADSARLSPIPPGWFAGYEDLLQYLKLDAEPWQEAECKRLLSENPALGNGLNDFGLRRAWGL